MRSKNILKSLDVNAQVEKVIGVVNDRRFYYGPDTGDEVAE